jgi:hypothetical protein
MTHLAWVIPIVLAVGWGAAIAVLADVWIDGNIVIDSKTYLSG